MRCSIVLVVLLSFMACKEKTKETAKAPNEEKMVVAKDPAEWEVLFDGSSFKGWHFYNGGAIQEPWKIEEGTMVFYPPKTYPKGVSYNIVTDKDYTNFELVLEWKVSKAGNSGIFWGVFEDQKYGQPYLTGPEIQVLDDQGHPDAKNGTTHQAGALYDMVAPAQKAVKPAGEWNKVHLTINHDINKGWALLNGQKVVEFPVHGAQWEAMIAKSKFADWEGFGSYRTGKIGLQDHGDIVAYRNISIRKL